jgi:hypothetical protein
VTVSFIGGGNRRTQTKPPTCCKSLTNFITYRVHLAIGGFELTTFVVIKTDCTGSRKSNYHTITTTMAPTWGLVLPSENRFLAINQAIADIIYNRQCPASHFLRLLGLMASCIDTVPYGCLHMRPIQIYLLYFWHPHIDGLHFKIPVFPILATHLMWWQQVHGCECCVLNTTASCPLKEDKAVLIWFPLTCLYMPLLWHCRI